MGSKELYVMQRGLTACKQSILFKLITCLGKSWQLGETAFCLLLTDFCVWGTSLKNHVSSFILNYWYSGTKSIHTTLRREHSTATGCSNRFWKGFIWISKDFGSRVLWTAWKMQFGSGLGQYVCIFPNVYIEVVHCHFAVSYKTGAWGRPGSFTFAALIN